MCLGQEGGYELRSAGNDLPSHQPARLRGFLRPPLVGMLMVIGLCGDGHRQASGREKGARM